MALYKDLVVYRSSYRLALAIHHLSLRLPRYLQYDIADQIRRASRSVPSNIAEGYARHRSPRDITFFLRVALGSNEEMLFNLTFMRDCELITAGNYHTLSRAYDITGRQLQRLISSLGPTR